MTQVPLNGTASNYQSVNWSTSSDGSFANATALNSIYYPGNGDRTTGSVNLILLASPVSPCVNFVSSTKHVLFDPCTGIYEPTGSDLTVTVEPNPSNGEFTLYINGVRNEDVRIDILDMQGKEVYNSLENSGRSKIRKPIVISGISGGIYFLKVTTETRHHVEKVVIR